MQLIVMFLGCIAFLNGILNGISASLYVMFEALFDYTLIEILSNDFKGELEKAYHKIPNDKELRPFAVLKKIKELLTFK